MTPDKRTLLERLFFKPIFLNWLETVYLPESDPDKRESLKLVCMGGASGQEWADHYDVMPIDRSQLIQGIPFDEAWPWYPAMERLLSEADPNTLVVQIGSSSGREMDYFSKLEPRLSYIGTDIDERIVARSNKKYARNNLQFKMGSAHNFLDSLTTDQDLILFSNGSLQYVQPEHLIQMFERLKARGNVMLVLGEPWRETGSPVWGNSQSRDRGNFSFSHEYSRYAEKAGLKIRERKLVSFHGDTSRHYLLIAQA
ncbi:MAG: class I SAM-dependent methyltransferase [Pseudomonadota bacterium]